MAKKLQVFGSFASANGVDGLVDVHHIERTNGSGAGVSYGYNFVAGRKYRLVNMSSDYVLVRLRNEQGKNLTMKDMNGADVDLMTLTANGSALTFIPSEGSVVLYLVFGGTGTVELEDVSLRVPTIEETITDVIDKKVEFNGQNELSGFEWVLGKIQASDGRLKSATESIVTGFIPVTGYENVVTFDGQGSFLWL